MKCIPWLLCLILCTPACRDASRDPEPRRVISTSEDTQSPPAPPAPDAVEAPPPEPACEPRVVLHALNTHEQRTVSHEDVRGGGFAYLVSTDGHKSSVLVTPQGRFDHIAPHHAALLLADGRAIYTARDAAGAFVAIDGEAVGEERYDAVAYLGLDEMGKRFAYVGQRKDVRQLVVDGEPLGDRYAGIDYPVFSPSGQRVAARVVIHQEQQGVMVDGLLKGPFDAVPLRAPYFSSNGQHVFFLARIGGKQHLMRDGEALVPCAGGFLQPPRPGADVPTAVCREARSWRVVEGKDLILEGLGQRPSVVFDAGGAHSAVVAAGGVWVDGAPRVTGASRILGVRFSPQGNKLAVLLEREGEGYLEMWDVEGGEPVRWSASHPVGPRDVEMGRDWGRFSAEGERFGYAWGGHVVVDDVMREGFRFLGFAGEEPVWLRGTLNRELMLGEEVLAAARGFYHVSLDEDGVRYGAREAEHLVRGCYALSEAP